MSEPEVIVWPAATDVAQAAARRIADALIGAVEARGTAHWVTTGGSTPGQIYRHLADSPLRETVPWDRVHLWWTDDRWVQPDDVLSNALACWDLLLREVPVPVDQVHVLPIAEAMRAGEGPEVVAERYEATMRAAGIEVDGAGFPRMDVILVGVGSDGHLFSVFPNSPTWDNPHWVQAVAAPTHIAPRVARVTLHPMFVAAARIPLVVVLGASKSRLLGELFGSVVDVRRWPAQFARRSGAVWLLDAAAAAGLPPELRQTPVIRPTGVG